MWNPPTGPPNDVRLRPAEARRQIAQAIEAAQVRDQELRDEVTALTTRRVELTVELAAAVGDAAEARELAKRALVRSEEAARDGQRADAARWTDAARVFALRMRDAGARAATLEAQVPETLAAVRRVQAAMTANAAHLDQVAVARLASLPARKAGRMQEAVADAKADVTAPIDFLVAASEREARAALEAAGALASAAPVVPVDEDDLEDEVDLDAADPLLDELRAELAPEDAQDPAPSPEEPSPPSAKVSPPPAANGGTNPRPRRAGTAGRR